MRKIFLFAAAVLCSAVMFAEEITSVSLTVVFPAAGTEITSQSLYTPSDNVLSVTCGNPDAYFFDSVDFWDGSQFFDTFDETALLPSTQYKARIYLESPDGYTFAGSISVDDVTVNGEHPFEVERTREDRVACTVFFTTDAASTLGNTAVDAKAVKRIVNGQLLIERDGKTFNAQGIEVK